MTSNWQIGDVVGLKDGRSDAMTVEEVSPNGAIRAVWFDIRAQLHRQYFAAEDLERRPA